MRTMYRLTKLGSVSDIVSDSPLRTESVEGWVVSLPVVGERVTIINEKPLDEAAAYRMVRTSPVTKINSMDYTHMEFETENSRYKLEEI
jgi:hypothetical protein